MGEKPELSVIIAAYNAQNTIRSCLRSLETQTARSSMEVILVDSSRDGTADIVDREFPWIDHKVFSQRKYCGDARNIGLARARGRIVGLMDADCIAGKNWAGSILKAHKKNSAPAIGGAIANGNPESLVGWAAYFSEFSAWMPGTPAGEQVDIAGANMSYKKMIFDRLGTFIPGTYCSDTEFHWRLQKEGLGLCFDPSIQISHHNISSFGKLLRHEFNHGCSFARVRVKAKQFSTLNRMVHAFCFGLIALKLFYRISLRNLRNPLYLKFFLLSLPLTLMGVIAWSLGEGFGYLKPHSPRMPGGETLPGPEKRTEAPGREQG
jgi:GT2 family glycosyltransferase